MVSHTPSDLEKIIDDRRRQLFHLRRLDDTFFEFEWFAQTTDLGTDLYVGFGDDGARVLVGLDGDEWYAAATDDCEARSHSITDAVRQVAR